MLLIKTACKECAALVDGASDHEVSKALKH